MRALAFDLLQNIADGSKLLKPSCFYTIYAQRFQMRYIEFLDRRIDINKPMHHLESQVLLFSAFLLMFNDRSQQIRRNTSRADPTASGSVIEPYVFDFYFAY